MVASAKKIAYVATVFSHLANFHIRFMTDLQLDGHIVHAYGKPDHCKIDVEGQSIVCRDIAFSRHPLHPGNYIALRSLMRWFDQEQYDLVHVHTPNASVITRISAALTGRRRVVYTAHGFHFYKGAPLRNWLLYYPVEWMMARFTDVLITINREDYERAKYFPVRKKVVYIPGVGVDVSRYQGLGAERRKRLQSELSITEHHFTVLCLAELNGNKNHKQLIYSVLELKRMGVPIVCLLAGTGILESRLKELVRTLGLTEEIRFLGFRRDVPELLQLCDVLTLLSKREGLPKVLQEASAAGKPMIVTDVRGSREIVAPGVNGYVVPVGDAQAVTRALSELYENTELREAMGNNSRASAEQYEVRRIAQQLDNIYAELG